MSFQAQAHLYRRQAASSASAITQTSAAPAIPLQTNVPENLVCGLACVRLGDTSECDLEQSQACLCRSGRYIASVDTCLSSRCTPGDAKIGSDYSYNACLFLGLNVSTIALPSATGIDLTSPPEVFNKAFVNVQAIMSSICAALLAISLVLGFLACRARARVETQTQQGTWTNMTSHAGSRSGRGLDPTATFASASYPPQVKQTKSMGMGMGMERSRGFTNRLTLDEEEWEMETNNKRRSTGRGMGRVEEGSGSPEGSFLSSVGGGKEDLDVKPGDGEFSPATFTTNGRSRAASEVELEGSTIHLATLSRGTGGLGRAI